MGAEDRAFESLLPENKKILNSSVVERMAVNHEVVGSIPTLGVYKVIALDGFLGIKNQRKYYEIS